MTDPSIDGWYRAVGSRATFAFRVEGGEVVECAPYGRKMIMGLLWGTAYMKLEQGGFTVERLLSDAAVGEPAADPERAMRFGYLLSEIEVGARRLLDNAEEDIVRALFVLHQHVHEAESIAYQVSRETLDELGRG